MCKFNFKEAITISVLIIIQNDGNVSYIVYMKKVSNTHTVVSIIDIYIKKILNLLITDMMIMYHNYMLKNVPMND